MFLKRMTTTPTPPTIYYNYFETLLFDGIDIFSIEDEIQRNFSKDGLKYFVLYSCKNLKI